MMTGIFARMGASWLLAFAAVAHSSDPSSLGAADEFVAESIEAGQYLGAVTLISRHGAIVSLRAHGRRELDSSEALSTDAIFRIYSMTKPITSVAALMLMEQGKFQLDDPIGKYLPEMRGLRPITVRDLFIHTAGFPMGQEDPAKDAQDIRTYVTKMSRLPLAAEPGTRFNYDGRNTVVLSRLIEIWSGQSFDGFLQERLFRPLRMHDTGFSVPKDQRHRIAQMTSSDAQGRLIASPAYAGVVAGEPINPYPSGAGGLYSTAADYARLCQMLLNGGVLDDVRILSAETVDLMMSNQLESEFRPGEGFGLGGYVVVDEARRGRLGNVGQFGWFGAAGTYFIIDRKEQLIALLMVQHLPQGHISQGPTHDPPKLSVPFYNRLYQSLSH
jgi:CubicO group peptidase (beta-lactamase class C family)